MDDYLTVARWIVVVWLALLVAAAVLLGGAFVIASREGRRERRDILDLLADPDLPEADREYLERLERMTR